MQKINADGVPVTSENTGPPGPAGAAGAAGVMGFDGEDGLDSFIPGPPGLQGPAGSNGSTGPQGSAGPAGFDGEDGADSFIPGPAGPAGANGTIGINGAQGPPGPSGLDGEEVMPLMIPGPQGPAGSAGSGASLTRISGTSGAAGADFTVQRLSANSSDITSTTPSVVMTTTTVGAGTWKFKYSVIYQTAATTTGIGLAVNHTGTVTQFASMLMHAASIATASNGIGATLVPAATGCVFEARPESVKDTVSFKTVGVVTANADVLAFLEGIIVVSVSGDLELKLSTEVAASAVRLMADSMLELTKIA
jgi:hypothetical protein